MIIEKLNKTLESISKRIAKLDSEKDKEVISELKGFYIHIAQILNESEEVDYCVCGNTEFISKRTQYYDSDFEFAECDIVYCSKCRRTLKIEII